MKVYQLFTLLFSFLTVYPIYSQKGNNVNLDLTALKDLDNQFATLYKSGKFDEALPLAEKRVEAYNGQNDTSYLFALNDLGSIYGLLGMDKEEEATFLKMQAAAKSKFQEESEAYIRSLLGLGHVYTYRGNYLKAEAIFKEAVDNAKKVKDKQTLLSDALVDLGELYNFMSKYEEAEQLILQAKGITERISGKDNEEYRSIIAALGMLYFSLSRTEEAAFYMQELVQIQTKLHGKEHPETALAINNLAVLYQRTDNLAAAENLFFEIKGINERTVGKEHPNYAQAISNLAFVYTALGKLTQAEPLYLEAKEIREKLFGKNHPRYASTLENLGMFYQEQGKLEEAEKFRLEALGIRAKVEGKDHNAYSSGLIQLARLYTKMKLYDKAQRFFIEAEEIEKNKFGTKSSSYIGCANSWSLLYLEQNKYTEAKALLFTLLNYNIEDKASSVFEAKRFVANSQAINSFNFLHRAYKLEYQESANKAHLDSAFLCLKAALKISEIIRSNFSNEKDKYRTLSSIGDQIGDMLEIVSTAKDSTKFNELFQYTEMNKAVIMGDVLKANRARALSDLPDSLAIEEISLQEKMDKVNKKIAESKIGDDKGPLYSELNSLALQVESFKQKIKNKYPKYHAVKYENITADATMVQSLLNENSLFLEYFINKNSLYVFAVSKSDVEMIPIKVTKDSLSQQIKKLHNSLSDYKQIREDNVQNYKDYSESAFWLYLNLVKPAISNKKQKHLIIVTDGELGHLPFEAFLTEASSSKEIDYSQLSYLVNNYTISYNYSATLWKENQLNEKKKNNGKMLAFASSYDSAATVSTIRNNRNASLRGKLQDLPQAQKEVEALKNQFSGDFRFDNNASELHFKELAGEYNVIHLAMHGLTNKQQPILSSLAFTETEGEEDNFLEAWEIARMKLNADLVVLSACETGYGKFQQGEGVMSLARSFMYAGVPSLVVSLWQVNDASTSVIMQSFYKNLAKGMDKAEALRQAKLDYIKFVDNPNAAHPAFWAPFIIIGDSRPIKIAQKDGGMMYWAIGGILLLALGGGVYALRRRKK